MNEALIQSNKEYRILVEETLKEAIKNEKVFVEMAEQRILTNGNSVYIVAATIGPRIFFAKGEKAFEAIDNIVNEAMFIGTPFCDDINVSNLFIGE